MNTTAVKPASILFIGWSSIIASGLMMFINLFSLFTYGAFDEMGFSSPLLSQYVSASLRAVLELYRYTWWWTLYGILYFAFVLVAGIQFVQLKAWGRKALEVACWVGFVNALIDTTLGYLIWSKTQEAFSEVLRGLGGNQYSFINQAGLASIFVGLVLWVVPCGGLIVFLKKQSVREAVHL